MKLGENYGWPEIAYGAEYNWQAIEGNFSASSAVVSAELPNIIFGGFHF